jgi:hypothetical protein
MGSEHTMQLVKELDKIRNSNSTKSYSSPWISFIVALAYLVFIFNRSINQQNSITVSWIYAAFYAGAFIILFFSFYQIIKYIYNKKLSLIIQSILDLETK